MKKNFVMSFFFAAVMLLIAGCASAPVKFTSVDEINGREFEELSRVTAGASYFALFDIFPIGATTREAKLKQRLLRDNDADALIDIELSSRHTWLVVGVKNTLIMTATPIRYTDVPRTKKSTKKSVKSDKKKKSKKKKKNLEEAADEVSEAVADSEE